MKYPFPELLSTLLITTGTTFANNVEIFNSPSSAAFKETAAWTVYVNDQPVPVYAIKVRSSPQLKNLTANKLNWAYTYVARFRINTGAPAVIALKPERNNESITIIPGRDITPVKTPAGLHSFSLSASDQPRYLTISNSHLPSANLHLIIYGRPIEKNAPEADGNIMNFGPGIHSINTLELHDGDRLYLTPETVLRGSLHAYGQRNIVISGNGIIDASDTTGQSPALHFEHCSDVSVRGITVIGDANPGISAQTSTRMFLQNITLINSANVADSGIILRNCQDVLIENSFFRTGGSAVAIKGSVPRFRTPVRNILVENCTIWNDGGHSLLLGPETQTAAISHICFKNCDILYNADGPALSIQNGDSAIIRQIHYKDIRIAQALVRLIDLWIGHSSVSKDETRGYIRDIFFDDITVTDGRFPPSSFFGFDQQHLISDVAINQLNILGQQITESQQGNFVINRYTENISINNSATAPKTQTEHGCKIVRTLQRFMNNKKQRSPATTATTEAVIAAWDFTQKKPGNTLWADTSGNGYSALMRNGAINSPAGVVFDGVDDYVALDVIPPRNHFAIILRFRMSARRQGMQTLIADAPGVSQANGFRLYVNDWGTNNRKLILETGKNKAAKRAYSKTEAVSGPDWHTLIVVINNQEGKVRFFVNGKDVTIDPECIPELAMHFPLRLGRASDGRYPFAGEIAELRIISNP